MGFLDLFGLLWQFMFECLLLVPIGFVMTRTRDLERKAQTFKILPPTLHMDLSPCLFSHPERDFSARPQPAIWRFLVKSLSQVILHLLREQRGCAFVMLTL